jgi:hypothetical protein
MPKPTIDISKLKGDALFSALLSASRGRSAVTASKPKGEAKLSLEQSIMHLEAAAKAAKATEWQPQALCHIQQIITCQCGAVHTSFLPGFFVRHTSQHTRGTQFRSATAGEASSTLPRETHTHRLTSNVCPQCFNNHVIVSQSSQLDLFQGA